MSRWPGMPIVVTLVAALVVQGARLAIQGRLSRQADPPSRCAAEVPTLALQEKKPAKPKTPEESPSPPAARPTRTSPPKRGPRKPPVEPAEPSSPRRRAPEALAQADSRRWPVY